DVGEDRLMHRFEGGGEDIEDGGAGLGILAAQDSQQSRALRRIGALVDNDRSLAMAEMDRPGPGENARNLQPIEFRVTVMTAADLKSHHRLAKAVRGQAVELTGTAIGTIAVGKFHRADRPSGSVHIRSSG